MIDIAPTIYVFSMPVDMRKSIDTLSILTKMTMDDQKDTIDFHNMVFVFLNKSRNKIKILLRDASGFWLLYKRLDRGSFKFKMTDEGFFLITKQQLRWLLEGLDFKRLKPSKSPLYLYNC
jgi:transposase